MIHALTQLDQQLFLWLNGMHNSVADGIMYWISYKFTWIPLYAFLIYLLAKEYKQQTFIIMLGTLFTIVVIDQLSVHLFKEVFLRPRPCHEPSLAGIVHIVNGECGGQYGFISSHAANTFGIAVFLIQFLKKQFKYFIGFILLWATLVSYSRIYLGAHYPGDVLCGAIFGSLIGYLISLLTMKFMPSNFPQQ